MMIISAICSFAFSTRVDAVQQDPLLVASETVEVMLPPSSPISDLIPPFLPETGQQLSRSRIPGTIIQRSDRALELTLADGLQPPDRARRAYVGFPKPDFENEFMWLTWSAGGRMLRWSDLDPESYLLIQLRPGELQPKDDDQFNADVLAWVTANLKIPGAAGQLTPLMGHKFDLPSGRRLTEGTIVSHDLERIWPNAPEAVQWATGMTYWTDGRVIALKLRFATLRPPEPPSKTGPRVPGARIRSRFSPPG